MYKILVVDDDVDLLLMTKMILARNNFLVTAISKWEEIDYSINAFHPDMILLDTYLSGADGRDICRRLKAKNETRQIPILLLSAGQFIKESLTNIPADGFIQKPFNVLTLVSKIDSILSAKQNTALI